MGPKLEVVGDARAWPVDQDVLPWFVSGRTVLSSVHTAVPVPAIQQVPAGFDAIFQTRADLIAARLERYIADLGGLPHGYFNVLRSAMPANLRSELDARLVAAFSSLGVFGAGAIAIGDAGDADYLFRVVLSRPQATLRPTLAGPQAQAPAPTVRWFATVEIGVPNAGAGTPGGGGVPPLVVTTSTASGSSVPAGGGTTTVGTGQPAGGMRFLPVAFGTAATTAGLVLESTPALYQFWARLDLSASLLSTRSTDPLFAFLSQHGLDAALPAACAPLAVDPGLRVTPRFALGGVLRPQEQFASASTFRPQMVSSAGNTADFDVLSLCVNIGPQAEVGDALQVQPFLGQREAGYFLSARVVDNVVRMRWLRPDTPKSITATLPLELEDEDGNLHPVEAEVQFTLVSLKSIAIAASLDSSAPDGIRLRGAYGMQILRLWDGKQWYGAQELGEYGQPEVMPLSFMIYPFRQDEPAQAPGLPPLYELAGRLVAPLYAPAVTRFTLVDVAGETSAAVGGLLLVGRAA